MCCACFALHAQTVIYSDNFDSYPVGSHISQVNDNWVCYGDSLKDATISNTMAASAPNSLQIGGDHPNLVSYFLPMAFQKSGRYHIGFNLYVPSSGNDGAYFAAWRPYSYSPAFICGFSPNQTGRISLIDMEGNLTSGCEFTYPNDVWLPVLLDIDLDANLLNIYINNVLAYAGAYASVDLNNYDPALGEKGLGSITFNNSSIYLPYYVDDFSLTELTPPNFGLFDLYPNTDVNHYLAPNTSVTQDFYLTNNGAEYTIYRIVPTYNIDHPDTTSIGATAVPNCQGYKSVRISSPTYMETAVRIPADSLRSQIGRMLKTVDVALQSVDTATIKVYGMGNLLYHYYNGMYNYPDSDYSHRGPYNLKYEKTFIPHDGWNSIAIDTPIFITGEDLYLSVFWTPKQDSTYLLFDIIPANDQSFYWGDSWIKEGDIPWDHVISDNFAIRCMLDGVPQPAWIHTGLAREEISFYGHQTIPITFDANDMDMYETRSGKLYFYSSAEEEDEFVLDVHIMACGVSIEGFEDADLHIYPNPTSEYVKISSEEEITEVQIFSMMGQLVCQKRFNSNEVTLPIQNLPGGIYTAKIFTAQGVRNAKIVKR